MSGDQRWRRLIKICERETTWLQELSRRQSRRFVLRGKEFAWEIKSHPSFSSSSRSHCCKNEVSRNLAAAWKWKSNRRKVSDAEDDSWLRASPEFSTCAAISSLRPCEQSSVYSHEIYDSLVKIYFPLWRDAWDTRVRVHCRIQSMCRMSST